MTIAQATVVAAPKAPRFSGHESFACRYAWLPKAHRALEADPGTFSDEEAAMLELGIGKNMVKSLRFWVEAMGVAAAVTGSRSLSITPFGTAVLGDSGLDPYLEDARTLWLLHWTLATHREAPLFAWEQLIGRWSFPEFTRSEALASFRRESAQLGFSHSDVTLSQHLDVFLHTYLRARAGSSGPEDSLDGPLVDLGLLHHAGERRSEAGRWEPVYAFRREAKPEITAALFDHCLMDYWDRFNPQDETLTLRAASVMPCSPGQVFKLTEEDVRTRLEGSSGSGRRQAPYRYQPSAVQSLLTRRKGARRPTLAEVYAEEHSDA